MTRDTKAILLMIATIVVLVALYIGIAAAFVGGVWLILAVLGAMGVIG